MTNSLSANVAKKLTDAQTEANRTDAWLSRKTGIKPTTLHRRLNLTPELLTLRDVIDVSLALELSPAEVLAS